MDGLHVYEWGEPGKPAVFFLHGAGVSGRMWNAHMARLRDYHCLVPDLPGHGGSSHFPWQSEETWLGARDLPGGLAPETMAWPTSTVARLVEA